MPKYIPSPQTLARAALARSRMSAKMRARSGETTPLSVKKASKEIKPSKRAKELAAKSAKAYGATKGLAVGGEHGGAGVSQIVDKGRVWSPDEVAALNKQRGTEPVELSPAEKRKAAIKAAFERAAAKKAKSFDVPTLQRQHDDLRDVHDSLHSRVTRSSMDEEAEQVDEGNVYHWDKLVKIHLKDAKNPNNSRKQRKHAESMASRALEASKMSDSDEAYRHYMGVGVRDNVDEEVEQIDEAADYTLKHVGTSHPKDITDDEDQPVKATEKSYEIHKGGKKVGELEHHYNEYGGHFYSGNLHGRNFPWARNNNSLGSKNDAHSYLASALKSKWHTSKHSATNEEVEQIVAEGLNEMDKSQPSSSRGAEGLPLGKKADPIKTDKVKSDALKVLQKQYKKPKNFSMEEQGVAEGIEGVELEEGKYASTIAAIAAKAYEPKVGDKVRTRKGGQIPGTVEKVEGNRVFFRHPEGKLYITYPSNLMREEVEQIDELKKKTLQSYKSKAQNEIESMAKDLRGKEYQTVNPQKIKNRASGIKLATAKLKKEEVESVNEDQAADWQKVQSMEKGSIIGGKDAMRTHLKYLNAVHAHQKKHGLDTVKTKKKIEGINRTLVQMGEEVEQIDEAGALMRKLVPGLGRIQAASKAEKQRDLAKSFAREVPPKERGDTNPSDGYHHPNTSANRHWKRHWQFQKIATKQKPFQPLQQKEEVEQVDEVTKQEAEKALGGPVKEKPTMPPGKQPAGHRYVRNLARRAMKAGLKNEEVEQIDETYKSAIKHIKNYDYEKAVNALNHDPKTQKEVKKHLNAAVRHQDKYYAVVDAMHKAGEKAASITRLSDKADEHVYNRQNSHNKALDLVHSKNNMSEEVDQVVEQDETMEKVEMAQTQLHFICYAANEIIEFVKMGGEVEEWYQNKLSKVHSDMESLHSYIEGEKRRTGIVKEEEQIDEKAPPGAKYERMVKHIKAKYAKDGLTGKERSIAYATAWKAYGKKNEETVTEAEGKVAVTPKEKDLAAHHGDKTKITYGDVIKARLKSAAAKKMGK